MKRTKIIGFLLIVILGLLVASKIMQYEVDRKGSCFNIRDNILNSIKKELLYEKEIFITSGKTRENRSVIYVLGGGQDSLNTRFRKASILYHKGLSNKIFTLSRAGTTEFYPDIGRNLTNDEWSIRELESFNVRREDIELVPIRLGLLGTANEAKSLPGIVRGKGYDRLILVTSSCHTKRAFTAFSRFAADRHLELFIYGSEDNANLRVLLQEYIKLFLYEKIVLPGYCMVGQGSNFKFQENRGDNVEKKDDKSNDRKRTTTE